MSGYAYPRCGTKLDIFKKYGGQKIAEELAVPFLGSIPIDPEICSDSDLGKPFIISHHEKVLENCPKRRWVNENFVSASANSLEASLDPRFGRCPYSVIMDLETMQFDAIPNVASGAVGEAGNPGCSNNSQ